MAETDQIDRHPPGRPRAESAAMALSALWVVGTVLLLLLMPGDPEAGADPLRLVLGMLAVLLPVAVLWGAVSSARTQRLVREETARLAAAVAALQAGGRGDGPAAPDPALARRLDELAAAARRTESALARLSATRPAPAPPRNPPAARPAAKPAAARSQAAPDEQPSLALGAQAEDDAPPLAATDLIRALNFPDSESDDEGFAALRRALQDRVARQVIQASQDVLTLLSQDGIYMDDLAPDLARPEVWRRFAGGERGRAVAALGGIRDRSSLALTAARMREDAIFRDAAHHFLRRFDQMLVAFEPRATDEQIVAMSDTRTARAFMLLGRVTGTFD
ncbi:hypothetical protein OG2516_16626 [Oceanicola granulosus HTCC2516]|uniref:Uncharacterized protein n=1 Tax=Oceanicola granulosus (strain ATCC BAA-861 / DSM 15982 / KCTC 12143 / HTCC2516) TaxID=314256 RepID=Q2CCF8_OCEGH|nr:hypothetical protein [Oceanicola granulosus]EAR50360.1 hypothetical protein OG2516_16626 [Oceanicola granulosus HTCC2516]